MNKKMVMVGRLTLVGIALLVAVFTIVSFVTIFNSSQISLDDIVRRSFFYEKTELSIHETRIEITTGQASDFYVFDFKEGRLTFFIQEELQEIYTIDSDNLFYKNLFQVYTAVKT